MPLQKKLNAFSYSARAEKQDRGNALILVLVAIAVLALLTLAISQSSTEQSSVLPQQTMDDQINRTITYAATLGGALQEMVAHGEDPNTLYSNLSLAKPGDAGFDAAPSNLKLYHPMGGGVTPLLASSPDANAVATNFNINTGSSIAGVGCTPGSATTGANTYGQTVTTGSCTSSGTGHIIFTALVSSAAYCTEFNKILNGSTGAPPTMDSSTFSTLFASSNAVAVTSALCASCTNTARLCVSNGSNAWGFYADLFPPQWVNDQ